MSESINIQTDSKGKVITAELAYSPFDINGFTYNGQPIKDAKYTSKTIKRLLSNHVDNAIQIREMSDYLYNNNGIIFE
jgi:hypothetical protein